MDPFFCLVVIFALWPSAYSQDIRTFDTIFSSLPTGFPFGSIGIGPSFQIKNRPTSNNQNNNVPNFKTTPHPNFMNFFPSSPIDYNSDSDWRPVYKSGFVPGTPVILSDDTIRQTSDKDSSLFNLINNFNNFNPISDINLNNQNSVDIIEVPASASLRLSGQQINTNLVPRLSRKVGYNDWVRQKRSGVFPLNSTNKHRKRQITSESSPSVTKKYLSHDEVVDMILQNKNNIVPPPKTITSSRSPEVTLNFDKIIKNKSSSGDVATEVNLDKDNTNQNTRSTKTYNIYNIPKEMTAHNINQNKTPNPEWVYIRSEQKQPTKKEQYGSHSFLSNLEASAKKITRTNDFDELAKLLRLNANVNRTPQIKPSKRFNEEDILRMTDGIVQREDYSMIQHTNNYAPYSKPASKLVREELNYGYGRKSSAEENEPRSYSMKRRDNVISQTATPSVLYANNNIPARKSYLIFNDNPSYNTGNTNQNYDRNIYVKRDSQFNSDVVYDQFQTDYNSKFPFDPVLSKSRTVRLMFNESPDSVMRIGRKMYLPTPIPFQEVHEVSIDEPILATLKPQFFPTPLPNSKGLFSNFNSIVDMTDNLKDNLEHREEMFMNLDKPHMTSTTQIPITTRRESHVKRENIPSQSENPTFIPFKFVSSEYSKPRKMLEKYRPFDINTTTKSSIGVKTVTPTVKKVQRQTSSNDLFGNANLVDYLRYKERTGKIDSVQNELKRFQRFRKNNFGSFNSLSNPYSFSGINDFLRVTTTRLPSFTLRPNFFSTTKRPFNRSFLPTRKPFLPTVNPSFNRRLPQNLLPSTDRFQNLIDSDEYEFSYVVRVPIDGLHYGRAEAKNGPTTVGEYFVLLPDGRIQHVTYISDEFGHRSDVQYYDSFGNVRVNREATLDQLKKGSENINRPVLTDYYNYMDLLRQNKDYIIKQEETNSRKSLSETVRRKFMKRRLITQKPIIDENSKTESENDRLIDNFHARNLIKKWFNNSSKTQPAKSYINARKFHIDKIGVESENDNKADLYDLARVKFPGPRKI